MSGSTLRDVKALLRGVLTGLRGMWGALKAGRREAELYADVRRYPASHWEAEAQRVRRLCVGRSYTPEGSEVWISHRYSLYLTMRWLQELPLPHEFSLKGVELGGESIVTDLLGEEFPAWEWRNTTGAGCGLRGSALRSRTLPDGGRALRPPPGAAAAGSFRVIAGGARG